MRGWRRALVAALAGAGTACARLASLLGHAALGVMTPRALEDAAARSGDELAALPLGVELFAWEERLYARILRPGASVLVVGCGTGRDLTALALRGHAVDGIDVAPRALEIARERVDARGLPSRLVRASATGFDLGRTYDLVVFSWYVFACIPGRAARVTALRCAARHLAPEGRVVITSPEGTRAGSRAIALTRALARLLRSGWDPEPGDGQVTLTGGRVGLRYERILSLAEVAGEVAAAGLVVVEQDAASGVGVSIARCP